MKNLLRWSLSSLTLLLGHTGWAQESYRYDRQTRASDYAHHYFGPEGYYDRSPSVDMGRFRAGVSSKLDCGRLDFEGNFAAEFKNLQKQIEALGQNPVDLVSKGAMMATCYAYPTVCAQLRHDFLAIQSNLNLRAQACRAIDDFIDSSADKGAKQLRAEAQAECVQGKLAAMTPAEALRECQNSSSGLPLRDFQAGLEKKFTNESQKVLQAIVAFSKTDDKPTYYFLASVLGEIEVQQDGYWQPLFEKGMSRPYDVAARFLADGQSRVCKDLDQIVGRRLKPRGSLPENTIDDIINRRITTEDVASLGDLGAEDRRLACAALGRAIGQLAAEKAAAKAEAILASGLLNTAIPNSLRDEYRGRGQNAFEALRKAIESDQIPPVEEVRHTIAQLARATREKNRLIASQISRGRLENYREESSAHSDCTDTLSCGGG